MKLNEETFKMKGIPLIKFQKADRIESLRKGHLYAKSLQYYRGLERETEDDKIGDGFEAMLHVNKGFIQFLDTGEVIELNDTLIQTANSNDFVFCMFGICNTLDSFSYTDEQKEKMLAFGDTALLVLDSKELICRIFLSAEKAGFVPRFDKVMYFDPLKDNGDMINSLRKDMRNVAFWKRDKYTYQQEYRIVFTPKKDNNSDHIELEIGNISDITAIISSEKALSAIVKKEL